MPYWFPCEQENIPKGDLGVLDLSTSIRLSWNSRNQISFLKINCELLFCVDVKCASQVVHKDNLDQ